MVGSQKNSIRWATKRHRDTLKDRDTLFISIALYCLSPATDPSLASHVAVYHVFGLSSWTIYLSASQQAISYRKGLTLKDDVD